VNLLERINHWSLVAPHAIAHVNGERTLTYGELAARSNAVAAYLRDYCGDDRTPVAVLGQREQEMVIAFLGAVKAGRPYIPINTTLPNQRIAHILEIGRPGTVLTPPEIADICQSRNGSSRAHGTEIQPDDPFYIIFTSGSSGEPKGIVVTHRCLEHFLTWMIREQKFADLSETFLNQAPFSFDLSVMDLYCSLATGGTLFSLGRDLIGDPKLLYRALALSNVTTWVSTPSFVEMCLVERGFNDSLVPRVCRFLFCGETLLPKTADLLSKRFPHAEIWNLYGPTEATVATTSVRIDSNILAKYPALPVGRPMPGTQVSVVDENRNSLPEGSSGEIIIKGPNVSAGYLRRADLTAAAFSNANGQRSYFTGDRGRFEDGMLFFEGRIDRQVKVNGHRIELGDVEENLRALPMVRDASVVPVGRNGKVHWLAGFVVPELDYQTTGAPLIHRLREDLSRRVPAYMLPRKFVVLDRFPITANGKIDRQKLSESL